MVIDLGAGDGKAVLRRARRDASTLVVAIEPVAAALAHSSRVAARPARRGGLPNTLFLSGSAEELPSLLAGRADEIVIALPWGALLDGVLAPTSGTGERLHGTLRPGGELTLLLSLSERDRPTTDGLDERMLARLASDYAALGFDCLELRPATARDVSQLSSSWGRRLGIPERRPAFVLRLRATPGRAPIPRAAAP